MPMAMAAMPEGGVPLLVLLMSSAYAAMQISPTHVCLFIAAECFKVNMGGLVKRNIPMILLFLQLPLCIRRLWVYFKGILGIFQEYKKKFLDRIFLHVYNNMACLNT